MSTTSNTIEQYSPSAPFAGISYGLCVDLVCKLVHPMHDVEAQPIPPSLLPIIYSLDLANDSPTTGGRIAKHATLLGHVG
jgi:hypothetical protein